MLLKFLNNRIPILLINIPPEPKLPLIPINSPIFIFPNKLIGIQTFQKILWLIRVVSMWPQILRQPKKISFQFYPNLLFINEVVVKALEPLGVDRHRVDYSVYEVVVYVFSSFV